MNLKKQQDTKSIFRNQRHLCTPPTKYHKHKSEKKISFAIATRKTKYLGVNLTKEVKDLCSGNFKILKKEMEDVTVNGSVYFVHG